MEQLLYLIMKFPASCFPICFIPLDFITSPIRFCIFMLTFRAFFKLLFSERNSGQQDMACSWSLGGIFKVKGRTGERSNLNQYRYFLQSPGGKVQPLTRGISASVQWFLSCRQPASLTYQTIYRDYSCNKVVLKTLDTFSPVRQQVMLPLLSHVSASPQINSWSESLRPRALQSWTWTSFRSYRVLFPSAPLLKQNWGYLSLLASPFLVQIVCQGLLALLWLLLFLKSITTQRYDPIEDYEGRGDQ